MSAAGGGAVPPAVCPEAVLAMEGAGVVRAARPLLADIAWQVRPVAVERWGGRFAATARTVAV